MISAHFIVFGGPVREASKPGFSRSLFLVNAESESAVERRLEADPYTQMDMLRITRIEPWEILLGNSRQE
jgi:uncharacterized protein YciI